MGKSKKISQLISQHTDQNENQDSSDFLFFCLLISKDLIGMTNSPETQTMATQITVPFVIRVQSVPLALPVEHPHGFALLVTYHLGWTPILITGTNHDENLTGNTHEKATEIQENTSLVNLEGNQGVTPKTSCPENLNQNEENHKTTIGIIEENTITRDDMNEEGNLIGIMTTNSPLPATITTVIKNKEEALHRKKGDLQQPPERKMTKGNY